MNKPKYYIAIDFDGTVYESNFPEIGEVKQDVINQIANLVSILEHKYEVVKILWTCREDLPERKYLTEAVEWCWKQGIEFDYINENPECDFGYKEKVRKIVADIYIDDNALNVIHLDIILNEVEKGIKKAVENQ